MSLRAAVLLVILLSLLAVAIVIGQAPEPARPQNKEAATEEPALIECPECHSPIPADSEYCPYCGTKLPEWGAGSATSTTISTIAAVLPKVLVLIDPDVASPWGANYTVFGTLATDLEQRGVPLVNPRFNQGIHWAAYQNAKSGTARDAASELGLKYQAPVVLTFSCKTLKLGFGSDLDKPYTSRATVSGYLLETASGRPTRRMMIVHRLGSGSDDEEAEKVAILDAATAFAREAFIGINEWAHSREQRGDPFLIRFLGILDYRETVTLKSIIRGIEGCSEVKQKSVSIGDPKKANFSELTLKYRGPTESLRRAVIHAILEKLQSISLKAIAKSTHLIEVSISRKEESSGPDLRVPEPEWATSSVVKPASVATIGVKRPASDQPPMAPDEGAGLTAGGE
ncbi:MAG: zinc ribbon domain-containing protein [Candidatus Coatesbacteria bacterium]|nr:zinc ribbon domain-containing protein [Candidatus Coatesbacteria bacterium]